MCFLALQITERRITHAINHSYVCCLQFGSGSPRTVGLFYLVLVMDAQTQADNVAKLDVRLVQLFTEYRVSPEVMAMCGHAGVDTVSTLAHLADDKTLFRAAFTFTVGLDPITGPKAVQRSHMVGGYSAACIWEEVDIRTTAERESDFMPVRSGNQERLNNRQTFDKVEEYELQDEAAPGQPYYDQRGRSSKRCSQRSP